MGTWTELGLVEVGFQQAVDASTRKKASLLLPIVGYEEESRLLVVRLMEMPSCSARDQRQWNKERVTKWFAVFLKGE